MIAVFETGGKQYKVSKGDELKVEKIEGPVGGEVEIDKVLLLENGSKDIQVGAPVIDGASVLCRILGHNKEKKVIVFKKKRRKGYKKKQGHRQTLTNLRVLDIRRQSNGA